MKKITLAIILLAGLFMIPSLVMAQSTRDEVTLVVSADGATKEEATKVALRSAIEQAYGTFVSANTTILNDELIKDEIVTVSQGNIKSYQEIASEKAPDGKTFVTLQATVCISKLVSYAKSKGASAEFAGATFGMNMKIKELNKQNEIKALQNLSLQVHKMLPNAFQYKLEVSEPNEISKTKEYGMGRYNFIRWHQADSYLSYFTIIIEPNELMANIKSLIEQTLKCLSLTEEEQEYYKSHNIKMYICDGTYYLRSDYEVPFMDMNFSIFEAFTNFEIIDNLGKISYIDHWEYDDGNGYDYRKNSLW